jgi:hypothetical protein
MVLVPCLGRMLFTVLTLDNTGSYGFFKLAHAEVLSICKTDSNWVMPVSKAKEPSTTPALDPRRFDDFKVFERTRGRTPQHSACDAGHLIIVLQAAESVPIKEYHFTVPSQIKSEIVCKIPSSI